MRKGRLQAVLDGLLYERVREAGPSAAAYVRSSLSLYAVARLSEDAAAARRPISSLAGRPMA